jgi:hypothetical protein
MCLPTPEFRGFARGRQGGTLRPKWESVPLQNAVGQSADTCSSRRRDDLDLDPLGRTAELVRYPSVRASRDVAGLLRAE